MACLAPRSARRSAQQLSSTIGWESAVATTQPPWNTTCVFPHYYLSGTDPVVFHKGEPRKAKESSRRWSWGIPSLLFHKCGTGESGLSMGVISSWTVPQNVGSPVPGSNRYTPLGLNQPRTLVPHVTHLLAHRVPLKRTHRFAVLRYNFFRLICQKLWVDPVGCAFG